jgi:hypothetical protein
VTVVSATLLAIYALDNPYRPIPGSIRPVAMERSLEILGQAREAIGDTSEIPCDDQGVAAR